MKNLTFPTKLTQGATKEQLLLEKEMNNIIVKSNKQTFIALAFMFTIIGFPIGVIILLASKPFKTQKRLRELQAKIDDIIIANASN